MKIADHLDKTTRKKLNRFKDVPKVKKKKKSNEILTERDLHDLMGVNRDRYERRGGVVRRK